MKSLLFILLLLAINVPTLLIAQDLHSPDEILQIMEQSTLAYELNSLKEDVVLKKEPFNFNTATYYRVALEDGGFATKEIELSEEAEAAIATAEAAFAERDYATARTNYEIAAKLAPNYSKMTTYIAQTYENEGDEKKGQQLYQQAIEQNPIDYMAHWLLGRNYLRAGNKEKALEHYLNAHILNRNLPLITKELTELLAEKGLILGDWEFAPQIQLSSPATGTVKISFQPEWLGYALTKAVWKYEPEYRTNMNEPEEFSIKEEKEALFALYMNNIEDKKVNNKPYFKALKEALDNKHINAYILYEMFLPEVPFIAYQLPDALMQEMRTYILENRCVKQNSKGKKKKRNKKRKK